MAKLTCFFIVYLKYKHSGMTEITIDKKKYVLIPDKEYRLLQKKAALKSKAEKVLSLADARAFSKKLIGKWATGK